MRPRSLLMVLLAGWLPALGRACIGGGGGGGAACCPSAAASCAPSVPTCPSSGYASSYAGSYSAPSYPRPLPPAGCGGGCGGQGAGCGAGCSLPAPQISIIAPPAPPAYVAVPKYANPPLPPLPPPPPPPPHYPAQNLQPPLDPGADLEQAYDDLKEERTLPGAGGAYGAASSYGAGDYNAHEPPPPPPAPLASAPLDTKPSYEAKAPPPEPSSARPASSDYSEDAVTAAPANNEVDEASLNCEDLELRKIVENALVSSGDNLDAARKIESEAAAKFGGRFNSIVSNAEFAYVNWYGKRNCQLRVNDRHSLTWED